MQPTSNFDMETLMTETTNQKLRIVSVGNALSLYFLITAILLGLLTYLSPMGGEMNGQMAEMMTETGTEQMEGMMVSMSFYWLITVYFFGWYTALVFVPLYNWSARLRVLAGD